MCDPVSWRVSCSDPDVSYLSPQMQSDTRCWSQGFQICQHHCEAELILETSTFLGSLTGLKNTKKKNPVPCRINPRNMYISRITNIKCENAYRVHDHKKHKSRFFGYFEIKTAGTVNNRWIMEERKHSSASESMFSRNISSNIVFKKYFFFQDSWNTKPLPFSGT